MRALLTVVLVATACRPGAPAAPFTLRMAVSGPLERVSPDPEMRSWTSFIVPIVFQALVSVGPDGEVVPVLAARVELAGPRELRVWPRSDARFSDGAPVTFVDIETSLASGRLHATREGDSLVIRSDDEGVPIELQLSRAYVFRRIAGRLVGTGAFAVDVESPARILLSRVVPAPGLIGGVRMDSYPTPQDAFARTLKGDADMLLEVQPRWVELLEGVPRLQILRAPGPTANMVAFNLKRLSRQERIALAAVVTGDEVRKLAFGEDCVPPVRRPDPEPLPAGRPLDVAAVPFFDRFAFAVRRSLGARGGAVRIAEVQDFVSLLKSGDFDLATIRPRIWPPITAALAWRTGSAQNLYNYSNPEVDAALDRRDWIGARRALEKDPPGAIVCVAPAIIVLDSRIRNASLTGAFKESLPQWEVAQ